MKLLNDELSGYTGTSVYYRLFGENYLTEGTKAAAEMAECFWFFDIIASVQYMEKMRRNPFQVWTLKKTPKGNAIVIATDGNSEDPFKQKDALYTQKIVYTDFKYDRFQVYVSEGVIYLPSEH